MQLTVIAIFFALNPLTTVVDCIDPLTSYTVIAIRGTVTNVEKGLLLRARSRFKQEDRLDFSSPRAKLLVMNERGQTFLCLKAKNRRGFELYPSKAPRNTRPGIALNQFTLQQYLSTDTIYVLDNQLDVLVSVLMYPMDEDHFFYLQYQGRGELVNKKLAFGGDTLFITKEDLYQIEGQQIQMDSIQNPTLFHYDSGRRVSRRVGDLKLVFLQTDQLIEEVKILLESLGPLDNKTQRTEIESFIYTYYGKTDKANFEKWLASHFLR